jgi:hypothetical protein
MTVTSGKLRVVLAAAALLAPAVVRAAEPQVASVTLNGLEIGLDRDSGGLVQLTYPATGVALRTAPGDGGILDVAYPVEGFIPMRLASRHSKARVEPMAEGKGFTIIYDPLGPSRTHCPLPAGKVIARVDIRAADDKRSVILTCSIENRSKGSIPQVLFPDLRGLRPFEGVQGTLLRMTNNVTAPFAGPPRPTEGAPFYGFQDGWRVFEYGGYYGPHVLRWIDVGGHKGGLSLFEKQWGGTNIPNLMLQRIEADPESLRLAWEHRVTIEPEKTWTSAEFWLTPHPGGWAKGIDVFRDYVRQVNPPRNPPRHIREGLGVQTLWLCQAIETDPKRVAFTYKDLVRAAEDAWAHGIDEMCLWGAIRGFQLPLVLEKNPGTREEFLEAVRAARKLGVHMTPFVSIALLTKPSLQPYGVTGVSPAWIYHPELIRCMDPYYQKSGYPVLGWEIAGAPLADSRYQADALRSFQSWIDAGVTSFGWDVVCSKDGTGAKTPLVGLLEKFRAAARAADPESVLCGELVPNGSLEYDNQLLDYLWCWVPFTEPEPLMAVLGAPRFGPTLEDHAIEVKKAFCAGLYMNLLPRKPDQPNGTALLSDKPELSAALKEVAPLRRQFLAWFAEGTPLGDSMLTAPVGAFVRGYQRGAGMLVIVLNPQQNEQDVQLEIDLGLWLPGGGRWNETVFDGHGRRVQAYTGEGARWTRSLKGMKPLGLAFVEIERL